MVAIRIEDFSDEVGSPPSGGQDIGAGLGPSYPYPVRKVIIDSGQLGGGPGYDDFYFGDLEEIPGTSTLPAPFTKNVRLPFLPSIGAQQTGVYVGPGLVDKNNKIVRMQYDETSDSEVRTYLSQFATPSELSAFLRNLEVKGFYEYGQPGNGYTNADTAAVKMFFVAANSFGRTGDIALQILNTYYPNVNSGSMGSGGRRMQYTSNEDLASIYRQVTQGKLGRAPKDEDVQRFVEAYHAIERQAQSGGTQNPMAAETLAGTQVEERYGAEEAAVGFTNLGEVMKTLIRGQ